MWLLYKHLWCRRSPRRQLLRRAFTQLVVELLEDRLAPAAAHFAIIGDFGLAGPQELAVSNLVHSWNPDFILTAGDNNYPTGTAPKGNPATIDANVGQYYHDFIYPYYGSYGAGSPTNTNRFWTVPGDKDWSPDIGLKAYLDYFTYPGNERYYTVPLGPVQFFGLSTDGPEPDGQSSTSVQANWLKNQLAASTAPWKIVIAQYAPYNSRNGGFSSLRWPFQAWGASAVFGGDSHIYERLIEDNNFPYFLDGLGGATCCSNPSWTPIAGSQVRYQTMVGAVLADANDSQITFQFIDVAGAVIDRYTLSKDPTLPTAPGGLRAVDASTTQVSLSWTDYSSNETGFKIERSSDGTAFTQIATVGANVLSYSDTGVTTGPTWYYRVRATNTLGDSPYSNVANDHPSGLPAPSGPTATVVSGSHIILSWVDNSSNETGFKVERSTDGISFTQIGSTVPDAIGYSDSSLTAGRLYYYRVRANNGSTNSAYSSVASATTPSAGGVPAAPSSLTTIAASTTQINLSWADNSSNETGFKVERSSDGISFTQIGTVTANVTSYSNTGLSDGTRYYYRVRASNAVGDSAYSNAANTTTALGAPASLTATAFSTNQVNLSWTNTATTASGVKVERSLDGTTFTPVTQLGATATSYSDGGLSDGTRYYYRVRATNTLGDSANSNTATAVTPLGVPASLTAAAASTSQVSLSWTNTATTASGVRVERSLDGTSFTQVALLGATATTYNDAGLADGTRYTYRVRATNALGDSGYSNTASAVTPLGAPANLTAAAASSSQVSLSWTNTATTASGVKVERTLDGTSFTQVALLGATATTYNDAGLADGTRYTYRVRATNALGDSGYSNTASAVTPLGAPAGLTATAVSTSQVSLSWTNSATTATGVQVERSLDGSTFTQIVLLEATANSYSDSSAPDGTLCSYRVRATNAVGDSAASNTASALTPLGAPASLTAQAASTSQVSLSWTNTATTASGVQVERSLDGSTFAQITLLGASATSYSDSGLSDGTQYSYQVRATNAQGDSAYSGTASAITALSAPTNLTATAVSTDQIDLSWANTSSSASSVQVERSPDGTTFTQVALLGADVNSYSDAGLITASRYYYQVRAANALEDSAYSNVASDITSAPPVPTNLAATAESTCQVHLTWTDNADNETGFQIERSPDGTAFTPIAAVGANVTSYNDGGLADGTLYYYQVRATNAVGDSPDSDPATALTPLSAPTSLTATVVSPTEIDLSWTNLSATATGFKVERSDDGSTFTQIDLVDASSTSYSDSGLTAGGPYYYRVQATNALEDSEYSSVAASAPTAPTGLTATAASASEIDLSWTNTSTAASGVKVERSTDGANFTQVALLDAAAPSYNDTDLTDGAKYYYRVRAASALGDSACTNTASSITMLSAPTDLTAAAVSTSQVSLSWTNTSATASGVQVERSLDGSTFTPVTQLGATATTYNDAGLADGTRYTYQVRATNALGDSAYSNPANATTSLGAPANLTATPASSSQVSLSWTNTSSSATGVQVERSLDGTSFTQVALLGALTTTYSDSGVADGTQYYYQVRATNALGDSAYSNTATTATPLGAPAGLTATAVSTSQVSLSWTNTAATASGVQVERSLDGSTFTPVTQLGATATSYSDSGRSDGTRYTYRVRATNALGDSAYSNTASAVTPLGAPANLTATAASSSQVNLSWTNTATTASGVQVERSLDGSTFTQIALLGATATTYSDSGLSDGTQYSYRVRATNAQGNSAYSNTSSTTTPLGIPASLTATAGSNGQVSLSWTDTSRSETGYKIERSTNGTPFTQVGTVGASVTNYSDAGLTGGTQYTYRVRATNALGDSGYSNVASAITLSPPAAPSGLTPTSVTTNTINLAWTDNANNETGFKIERSTNGTSFTQVATVNANVTTFGDTGLTAGVQYSYRVRASNSVGDSAYSNVASASLSGLAAPSALTATAVKYNQIDLAWTDNSTNETGFTLERSTDGTTWVGVTTVGANVTTYSHTGRTANKLYYYRVKAVNAGGGSAYSNVASAITSPPAAPSGLTATAVSNTQVNLAWTDNSDAETGFKVSRSTNGTSYTLIATLGANVTTFSDTGRIAGQVYYYQVKASNAVGDSAASNVASATTYALAAPSGLTATPVSTSKINLTWTDNTTSETGFKIERSLDGIHWVQITTVGANITSFSDTGLTSRTKYWYRLRATNTLGDSTYSNLATATTL